MLQANWVGPSLGTGGTSLGYGTYHGLRKIPTFSSPYLPHEHIFEDRSEKVKNFIEVGPWRGNGGTSLDDGTYHGVGEIALEENESELEKEMKKKRKKKRKKKKPWYDGPSWDDWTYDDLRETTPEENGSEEIEVGPWARPRCYRDPRVLTDKSTPSPAPALRNF
ncbi:hypothetical protein NL676_029543 [Syzygium grande]|nr:hypothetical protein NL676_029543 [Syzygium grande]